MVAVILAFLVVDLFDTTGTLMDVAHQAQLLDKRGQLPRMRQALIVREHEEMTISEGGSLQTVF